MAKFTALPLQPINDDTPLRKVMSFNLSHLEDPATDIYTDFSLQQPHIVSQGEKINFVEDVLAQQGSAVFLVEDDASNIVGLFNINDILGPKAISAAGQQRVEHDNLMAKSVMTPISKVPAIDIGLLKYAKIGNIIETLDENKSCFLLVTQTKESGELEICGLFTLSHIRHGLHKNITLSSFLESSVLGSKQ